MPRMRRYSRTLGRALERQPIVDRLAAGVVGVADHRHAHARVEALRELVEHRSHLRLDLRAADVEREVARHVDLELVVLRARDVDAGALRGPFHLRALVFHALGPQVAGHCTNRAADHGTLDGAVAAAGGSADHRAGGGTDAGTLDGATLALAHRAIARAISVEPLPIVPQPAASESVAAAIRTIGPRRGVRNKGVVGFVMWISMSGRVPLKRARDAGRRL